MARELRRDAGPRIRPVRPAGLSPDLVPDPDDPDARSCFLDWARRRHGLTPRVAEVLWHTCRGLTSAATIARLMGIDPRTVKSNRRALYLALRVSGLTDAVRAAWWGYEYARWRADRERRREAA